jgi:membrane protein DedA with SNARE-associated domain
VGVIALPLWGWSVGEMWHSISSFFNEENLIKLLKEYGYIILFMWSFFEGETGLIMAGILSYTGDMNLWLAIVVAALGGFLGDQFYFYLGRWNKGWILEELGKHRRQVARARLLLRKYGVGVIFIQRFLYGMRTIIPMTIGLAGYDPKKFAFFNLISAFIWASVSIIPAYIFGEELLDLVKWLKQHWYVGLAIVGVVVAVGFYFYRKGENSPSFKTKTG